MPRQYTPEQNAIAAMVDRLTKEIERIPKLEVHGAAAAYAAAASSKRRIDFGALAEQAIAEEETR